MMPRELSDLIGAAAEAANVTRAVILSGQRGAPIAAARAGAMWLATNKRYSLPRIGMAFDRDHSTVIHARRRVDAVVHGSKERDALLAVSQPVAIKWIADQLLRRK